MASPGFGQAFTEHMVSLRWSTERGWYDGRVLPYQPLEMDPAMVGLHYGQIVFEGLKVYRQQDGSVGIFRPHAHARRFQSSARRLVMPELDEELFLSAVEELVRVDRGWVPEELQHSLYLRPIMFATDPVLALRPAAGYRLLIIAFVVEGFFNNDLSPVTVWISEEYSRAAVGGTGQAKCAANYAGAFIAQVQAAAQGCDQVVWLDSVERRWVEEAGGMNLFFVRGSGEQARLITPPLTGTLLPGVTRDALLTLAPELGIPVDEAPISVGHWREGCASGEITEVFACGTAARIAPIGAVRTHAGNWTVADGRPGPITLRLAEVLSSLQHGELPDRHGWVHVVD